MELEGSQPHLRIPPREVGQSLEHVQSQATLEELQTKLDQSQIKLTAIAAQLDITQAELDATRAQLAATDIALVKLQQHVDWMETSKFWQLRERWLKLKDLIDRPLKVVSTQSAHATVRIAFLLQRQRWHGLTDALLKVANRLFTPSQLIAMAVSRPGRFSASYYFAEPTEYAKWISAFEPSSKALKRQRADARLFTYQPKLSVVLPIYKLPLSVLQETLASVFRQTYPNWELCLAYADATAPETERYLRSLAAQDDRIKLSVMPVNLGISGNSNEALQLATGEFVVLLDHDDTLADFAFYEVVKTLNQQPDLDFLYSDKDCISENGAVRSRLLLKPRWSPEILYSANYLTHLCVIRRELLTKIGGFRPETDGAQDWDLFLRVVEQTDRIARSEGILYHWRIIRGSTSLGIESKPYALEAQLESVQSHLDRSGLQATATLHPECGFQIEWAVPATTATILVDGDVDWQTLTQCLRSLVSTLDAERHTVCVVVPDVLMQAHQAAKATLEQAFSVPLKWMTVATDSAKVDVLATAAQHLPADVITLVSGKIVRFQPGWLQELTGWVVGHPAIGFASALVIAETGYVVEAGLVVDRDGNGSPLMRGNPLYSWGEFGGSLWYRNCSASSPWAIVFRYDHYLASGGLPTVARSLPHAVVKLCQATCASGKRGLVNPHARVFLRELPCNDIPEFHASLADDPYFHPAFGSVVPLKLKVKDGKQPWGS